MAEWFEEWFNTEEYLNVYRHRNEIEALQLVNLILSAIKLPAEAKVLDLACGSGRHSVLFALKGYAVTAVDLSKNLLEIAKKSSNDLALKINLINCDLRKFFVHTKFNLIVNLFTSFGYFDNDNENFDILKTAFNHLLPKGYFVLDYFNKNFVEKNLIPKSKEEITGGIIIQERSIERGRVVKKITIRKNGKENCYYESVRMYSHDELLSALSVVGFKVLNSFGDFDGNPFDMDLSERIIIISQK